MILLLFSFSKLILVTFIFESTFIIILLKSTVALGEILNKYEIDRDVIYNVDVLEVYKGESIEYIQQQQQQLSGDQGSGDISYSTSDSSSHSFSIDFSSSFGSFETNITALPGCDPHLEEATIYILSGRIYFHYKIN